MDEFKRLSDEDEIAYIWRICYNKDKIGSWQDVGNLLNEELGHEYTESHYRKMYQNFNTLFNSIKGKFFDDEYNKMLDKKKLEIDKARTKLNTTKIEYNRWLRDDAREELLLEQIIDSIKSISTEPCDIKPIPILKSDKEYCLCIADSHFGKDFKLYGLQNEIINEYSPEIFYKRMEIVFNDALEYIEKENINFLKVFNLGDSLDGFLRNSQIWTLRYGVVDSAIIYGKYMAEWFKKLSEKVRIEYHPTSGNHAELRLLDGIKGEHLHEDIEKIVNEIIAIRNEDNPNFTLVTNKTGLIFTDVAGFKILGIHGEVKNPVQAIKDFTDIYGANIDIMMTGHKHHGNFINCGFKKQIVGIGSIVGTDDFSIRLRRQADATANILTFEYGKGLVNNHIIVLN
jgi:hypothetical protein